MVSYAWQADGAPILGATTASYVAAAGDLGKKIKVVVTDADGKTFESAESEAVKSDKDIPVTGVAISNDAPKVGQAVESVLTPAGANNVVAYAWYALDKIDADYKTLTPVGTESSYTPSQDDKGKYLQVVVVDSNNVDFASSVSSIVTEDKAAEIKLIDKSGLQTDGTALPNDNLEVSYGSDLGTPKTIIWYCDGAAKDAYTLEGNAIARGFNNATILDNNDGEMSEGVWYVSIENTEGVTSTTNTITVAKNNKAVLSDFAISDDYATANAAGITFASGDDTAVITVSLNKDYDGVIYVYKDSKTSYADNNFDAMYNIKAASDEPEANGTYVKVYAKASDMTEKNAVAAVNAIDRDETNLAGTAIKYVDKETGKTTYMFVPETGEPGEFDDVKASLVRGTSYKLVFDQDGIDSDDIGPVSRKDVIATESFEVPYVEAPAAIKVTNVTAGADFQAAAVELYADEACTEALTWLGNATIGVDPTDAGLTIKAFTNTKNNTTDGKAMDLADGAVIMRGKLGGFVGGEDSTGLAGLYATLRANAGVYGKNSINLTSEVATLPAQSVGEIKTSYDKKNPDAIKVSFKGLKTAGTVYVIRTEGDEIDEGDIAIDVNKFDKDDSGTYVKSEVVSKTSAEIVIEDVVDRLYSANKEDAYSAVFVPDNDEDFQQATTALSGGDLGDEGATYCVVDQQATTYKISGKATGAKAGGAGTLTEAVLDTYDQFGDDMDTAKIGTQDDEAQPEADNCIDMAFTGASGSSANQALAIAVCDAGVMEGDTSLAGRIFVAATSDGDEEATVGDIYKYKIEDGAFIQLKCTKAGAAGTAEFTVSIVDA